MMLPFRKYVWPHLINHYKCDKCHLFVVKPHPIYEFNTCFCIISNTVIDNWKYNYFVSQSNLSFLCFSHVLYTVLISLTEAIYHMTCQITFAYKNRDWWTNDRSMSLKNNYDTIILLSYDSYHKLYNLRRLYMEKYMVTLNTDSLSRVGRFGNNFRLTYSRQPMHFF